MLEFSKTCRFTRTDAKDAEGAPAEVQANPVVVQAYLGEDGGQC